jgi:hypothetical protein
MHALPTFDSSIRNGDPFAFDSHVLGTELSSGDIRLEWGLRELLTREVMKSRIQQLTNLTPRAPQTRNWVAVMLK